MIEDGAYNRLLDLYYVSDRPLPEDREKLFSQIRAYSGEEKAAVEKVLSEYWKKGRFGFTNRRAKKERIRVKKLTAIRVNAAKSGNKRRALAKQMRCTQGLDSRYQIPDPEKPPIFSQFSELERPSSYIKKGTKNKTAALPLFVPPIPESLWPAFVEMRKKIRKPMTAHAEVLIVKKINRLAAAGEDPTAVVEQSIRNDWQDVYPVRKDYANATDRPSREQLRYERSQENIGKALGHRSRLADALRSDVPRDNHPGTSSTLPGDVERYSPESITPGFLTRRKKE